MLSSVNALLLPQPSPVPLYEIALVLGAEPCQPMEEHFQPIVLGAAIPQPYTILRYSYGLDMDRPFVRACPRQSSRLAFLRFASQPDVVSINSHGFAL